MWHEAELISFQGGNKYHINHKDTFGEYVYSGMGVLYKKLLAGNRRKALEASLADREQLVRQVCQVTHDVSGEDAFVGIANTYDLLLCGSDQIWNPKWYHANYYAAYPEITVPKCSYASSIGLKEYNAGQNQEWERAVCGFDKVSSREAAGCAILGNILHQNVPQVMDPVFINTK